MMMQLKNLSKVPGWFDHIDQEVFDVVLTLQNKPGNILEIGSYLGKSAIYLGKFLRDSETLHVCDIFDLPPTNEKNLEEILNSYNSYSLSMFKKNFLKFHNFLPEIHVCESLNLEEKINSVKFRFIHIDGSHLYPTVNQDIKFALSHLDESEGVIALDDYRAQHTPAVANALWANVASGKVRVLMITEHKAYVVSQKSNINLEDLEKSLSLKKIRYTPMIIESGTFIRVLPEIRKPFHNPKQLFQFILPPILFSLIFRFKNKF